MRKGFVIFLLFVSVYPFFGTRAFLLFRKAIIKREVRTRILDGIEQNELTTLVFALSDLNKLLKWEHSKEFEYQGEMYDVVVSEERGDSVFLHCIADHAETRINRFLGEMTAQAANSDPPFQRCLLRFFDFLKSLFVSQPATIQDFGFALMRTHFFYLITIKSYFTQPPSPPPRILYSGQKIFLLQSLCTTQHRAGSFLIFFNIAAI